MVNILSMLAAILILGITVGVGVKYVNQMKNDTASGELADENWDGIGEYKNDLPIGWAVVFLGTIVWAIWYWFAGYPLWAYSQIGEWNEEVATHQEKFEEKWSNISEEDLSRMGEAFFSVNCAPCHGVQGDGMDGKAADLTKRLDASAVEYAIRNGSDNHLVSEYMSMPAGLLWNAVEIKQVSNYVASGFTGIGKDVYEANCASCHGMDGMGIPGVGANIRTFTPDLIKAVLDNGKKGAIGSMPSFKGRFTDTQEKAVSLYIEKLRKGEL
jgi:cytochrome c oxidase cbb3-type subunit 3